MSTPVLCPPSSFTLPDLFEGWPLPRAINSLYEEVGSESQAWFSSLEPFEQKLLAALIKCKFGLLAGLSYPNASREHLRTGYDMMFALWMVDEISDRQCADDVQKGADLIMDILRNPYDSRPEGESALGTVWQRALPSASPSAAHRFVEEMQIWVNSVVQEATDRDHLITRTFDDFLLLRRQTGGVMPCFAMIGLGMDLPDSVIKHPAIVALTTHAIDMVILSNDIYSYNVEQARGDHHNLVITAMRERRLDLQGAMDHLGQRYHRLRDAFFDHMHDIPSWSPEIDADVKEYLVEMGRWVTGNMYWSFESERYFGPHGLEIREHRNVILLPRQA
ncbi:terpenoid synthase [Sistotremastrum suecicum HHB10207 ss-3]|uniref:Terpene synthase n=1 Tax=Sistotremastrum suecicum HHB10207 ss-3 TaxID=1314776 RepID=A0A166D2B5_9AGAM|nr:terpenoid synthase [Sistotremastrum suecicum HHB10207 ss-3]